MVAGDWFAPPPPPPPPPLATGFKVSCCTVLSGHILGWSLLLFIIVQVCSFTPEKVDWTKDCLWYYLWPSWNWCFDSAWTEQTYIDGSELFDFVTVGCHFSMMVLHVLMVCMLCVCRVTGMRVSCELLGMETCKKYWSTSREALTSTPAIQ